MGSKLKEAPPKAVVRPEPADLSLLRPAEFRRLLRESENQTSRTTSFTRHEDVFAYLKEDVVPAWATGRRRLDGLVIGPGLSPPMVVSTDHGVGEMKWSFEHLQLADIFEDIRRGRQGFDYGITVLEKDPLVAEAVRRQDALLLAYPASSEYPEYQPEKLLRYVNGFMSWARKRELTGATAKKFVKVPPEVTGRIRVFNGSVEDSPIPPSDMIFYLTVSIYVPQEMHPQIAKKISGALNPGGILVTSNHELRDKPEKYGLTRDSQNFRDKTAVLRKNE